MHQPEVERLQPEITCQAKRPPQGQKEATSRFQAHRFGHAFHGEPALSGNNRIAFDTVVLGELKRPFASDIEAAAHRVLRFQKGEHA
jgi:hypothetical protein